MPPSIALLVFDSAINSGIGRAVRWLQDAASVAQDGVIGPRTLQAIDLLTARPGGSGELCAEFDDEPQHRICATGCPVCNYPLTARLVHAAADN